MSWEVNGVVYHDRAEAERAAQGGFFNSAFSFIGGIIEGAVDIIRSCTQSQQETRVAEENITSSQNTYTQNQNRSYSRENQEDMRRMQNSLRQERAYIEENQEEMRRMQNRLRQEQQRVERESEERHQQAIRAANDNQELIRELQRDHQQHQVKVQEEFAKAKQELENHIGQIEVQIQDTEERLQRNINRVEQEAELQREEMKNRLQEEIDRVDQRVTDMEERQRLKNEYRKNYTRSIVQMVEERLAENKVLLEEMDFRQKTESIQAYLRQALREIEQGNYETAISHSSSARIDLEEHIAEALDEKARMNEYKKGALAKLRELNTIIEKEEFKHFFGLELHEIKANLNKLQNQIENSFQNVRRSEIHADKFDDRLCEAENHIESFKNRIDSLKVQEAQRNYKIQNEIFPAIEEVLGEPLGDVEITLSIPGDPKSDYIIDYPTSIGGKVRMTFSLNGEQHYDGFGFIDNEQCKDVGSQVVEVTGHFGKMNEPHFEEETRSQPKIRRQNQQTSIKSQI